MTALAMSDSVPVSLRERPRDATTEAKRRAVGPDVLRSLAILLVMLVHLPLEATPWGLVNLRNYGWLGVDVFFVLSGYLIGTQLFKEVTQAGRVDFKSFYLRRAFRIFPAYFAVLAVYALVPILRDSPEMQPVWRFATFTVNFGLDPRLGNAFTQAWTLSVEEQFYLVLPMLVLFLHGRLSTRWTVGFAGLIILSGILLRFAIWQGDVGPLVGGGQVRDAFAVYLRDIYYPTYTRLDGLVFGVLLAAARYFRADLYRRYLSPALALSVGTMLVLFALVLFSIRGPLAETNAFLVFQAQLGAVAGFPLISIGIALILGALLDFEHILRRWPVPGAATVATLSFSLYLTHKSVFQLDRLIFGKENLDGLSGFAIYGITSFAVAAMLWFCVERTFLRLRERVVTRH